MLIPFDCVVIGGGIVGLAVAARLSARAPTLLVERNSSLLRETSSHNSGVVHAGLYYPADSLKTKLCLKGNRWIWQQQRAGRLQPRDAVRTGKWIVATSPDELPKLESLRAALAARGMPWRMVPAAERAREEPELRCIEALESTDSGVVDVAALAALYEADVVGNGGVIMCNMEARSLSRDANGALVELIELNRPQANAASPVVVQARCVVNCAGLFASRVARQVRRGLGGGGGGAADLPAAMEQHLCRGAYAALSGPPLTRRLLYPCPLENLAGLGVHTVVDAARSTLLFGPNVEWLGRDDGESLLEGTSERRHALPPSATSDAFLDDVHRAVARYLPRVDRSRLHPAFVGLRPKLSGPGEPFRDFHIALDETVSDSSSSSGCRVVHCLGIESPGLTASAAIARHVEELLFLT
jgi:2-hydroxyglutarate dehydrogenase